MPDEFNIQDVEEYVAFLRVVIDRMTSEERTPEKIRIVISEKLEEMGRPIGEDKAEDIARYFETQYTITQSFGHSLKSKEFEPWLDDRKPEIDFHYWNRFEKYLRDRGEIPPPVIERLDQITDEILNFAGNPDEPLKRRGMVIGHVQSGKTSNYSGVICKAADAGYKVIILLTGLTNSLRRQTQERIDEAFIGRRAQFEGAIRNQPIGAALFSEGNKRFSDFGTSIDSDFSLRQAKAITGFNIDNRQEPIIFTLKKNTSTLGNLRKWLQQFYPDGGVPHPLLLIDDEADNASINTKKDPDETTRINGHIRAILNMFAKRSYIGYTATPFANIFIDPETADEMLNDDLFPEDYIKTLDAPNNYVGPDQVFRPAGRLRKIMVRTGEHCDDYQDLLPLKHKNNHPVEALPESLLRAVRYFFIVIAVRMLSGNGNNHCTMMVNVSRFNSVQDEVMGLIGVCVSNLKNAIRLNGALGEKGLKSPEIQSLKEVYEDELSSREIEVPKWPDIQKNLYQATTKIKPQLVNIKGKGLDYDKHKKEGLHVIAVGGLALSRGLTLEGLCVSYVLRNAGAYDVLMQMARWFGYRPGYEDLCRLFIPAFSDEYYAYITDVINELRGELSRMEQLGLTPREFGLMVRDHPDAIRITAANKMRTASTEKVSISLSGKNVEGHAIFADDTVNTENRKAASKLLNGLRGEPPEGIHHPENFWPDVPVKKVLDFMSAFKLPGKCQELARYKNGQSLAMDYISEQGENLKLWDVCITEGEAAKTDEMLVPGKSIKMVKRTTGMLDKGIFSITSRRGVSTGGDARYGVEKDATRFNSNRAYNKIRKRGLLTFYIVSETLKGEEGERDLNFSEPCITYTLSFPELDQNRPVVYAANRVWQQLNLQFEEVEDPHDDEDTERLNDQ